MPYRSTTLFAYKHVSIPQFINLRCPIEVLMFTWLCVIFSYALLLLIVVSFYLKYWIGQKPCPLQWVVNCRGGVQTRVAWQILTVNNIVVDKLSTSRIRILGNDCNFIIIRTIPEVTDHCVVCCVEVVLPCVPLWISDKGMSIFTWSQDIDQQWPLFSDNFRTWFESPINGHGRANWVLISHPRVIITPPTIVVLRKCINIIYAPKTKRFVNQPLGYDGQWLIFWWGQNRQVKSRISHR